MFRMFFLVLLMFLFIGCGSSSSSTSTNTISSFTHSSFSQFQAQLGPLSEATVKIYKIENNGTKTLLYTETTSSGSSFEDIGYFDTHADTFEDNSFYLYEVSGGQDIDADDDGVLDGSPTTNSGSIRLLAKGSDLKITTKQIRATVLSEIVYASVNALLKNDLTSLQSSLDSMAKSFFSSDINGDGVIDYGDVLSFNPVSNQANLKPQYVQTKLATIITKIHTNDLSYLVNVGETTISTYSATNARSIVVSSDEKTVYMGSETGLEKLNISDLNNIVQLKVNASLSRPRELLLSKDESTLYIIDENRELLLLDTVSMNVISSHTAADDIRFFTLSADKNILYLGTYTGVEVLNVSNSNAPVYIRTIVGSLTRAIAMTLSTDSTKLLVCDFFSGLAYFDVSDIVNTNATELSLSIASNPIAIAIATSSDEKYAYFVNRNTDRLIVYDLVNNTPLGSVNIKFASAVDLSAEGKYLFISDAENIHKVDISDVNNPILISTVVSADTVENIQISGDDSLAYIATSTGFKVLSLNPSANSIFSKIIETTSNNNATLTLSEDENYAYIGHSNGFSIYNLSTGSTIYDETASSGVYAIVLDEDANKVYVRENTKVTGYNISDKSTPTELTNSNVLSGTTGLFLSAYNKKVFSVDNSTNILHVLSTTALNSSDDANSENISTSDKPYDVISDNNNTTVFVAQDNGLAIYSYTNYSNMSADDFELLSENLNRTQLRKLQYNQDKELLFAGTISGLVVYDVSDKTAPSIVTSYGTYATDIQMSNDKSKLYVQNESQISILNISAVSNIHEIMVIPTTDNIYSVKESFDSQTLYALTRASILKYDIGFLNDLRGEIAPTAQDLNITATTRPSNITLLGSDADSDDSNLSYIITKPPVIVGKNYFQPTVLCTNSSCTISPNVEDQYDTNYTFSYEVFDGNQYSNEATVNVSLPEYFGFDASISVLRINTPNTTGTKAVTFTNPTGEAYTVSTNSLGKLDITTEQISSTQVKVIINVNNTSTNISFEIELTIHSLVTEQNSTKIIDVEYRASQGAA